MFGQWRAETVKKEGLSSWFWAAHLSGSCSVCGVSFCTGKPAAPGIICHASICQHLLRQLDSSVPSSRPFLWPLSARGPQAPSQWSAETGHILRTCFPGSPSNVMSLSSCLPLNTSPGISWTVFCWFQGMILPMGGYLPEVMSQNSTRIALKELPQHPVSMAAPPMRSESQPWWRQPGF